MDFLDLQIDAAISSETLHPGRLESSPAPLRELQISHNTNKQTN
jgi:hypothetical protein